MAAEFFLSKGFQNFAFYGYRDTVWSQERCEGFYECIAAQGFGNNFYSIRTNPLMTYGFMKHRPAQLVKVIATTYGTHGLR